MIWRDQFEEEYSPQRSIMQGEMVPAQRKWKKAMWLEPGEKKGEEWITLERWVGDLFNAWDASKYMNMLIPRSGQSMVDQIFQLQGTIKKSSWFKNWNGFYPDPLKLLPNWRLWPTETHRLIIVALKVAVAPKSSWAFIPLIHRKCIGSNHTEWMRKQGGISISLVQ